MKLPDLISSLHGRRFVTDTVARRVRQLLFLLLIAVVPLGCSETPAEIVGEEEVEVFVTPQWIQSNADESELAHELNEVRKATQVYDVEKARADGYTHVSPFVPGMGFHFERGNPPEERILRIRPF